MALFDVLSNEYRMKNVCSFPFIISFFRLVREIVYKSIHFHVFLCQALTRLQKPSFTCVLVLILMEFCAKIRADSQFFNTMQYVPVYLMLSHIEMLILTTHKI
jgi:hypothetical protein